MKSSFTDSRQISGFEFVFVKGKKSEPEYLNNTVFQQPYNQDMQLDCDP